MNLDPTQLMIRGFPPEGAYLSSELRSQLNGIPLFSSHKFFHIRSFATILMVICDPRNYLQPESSYVPDTSKVPNELARQVKSQIQLKKKIAFQARGDTCMVFSGTFSLQQFSNNLQLIQFILRPCF